MGTHGKVKKSLPTSFSSQLGQAVSSLSWSNVRPRSNGNHGRWVEMSKIISLNNVFLPHKLLAAIFCRDKSLTVTKSITREWGNLKASHLESIKRTQFHRAGNRGLLWPMSLTVSGIL